MTVITAAPRRVSRMLRLPQFTLRIDMMKKRILLLGKNGQVGHALHKLLVTRGAVVAHSRATCEMSDPDRLRSAIRDAGPDIIINAAAYTAVDQAEADEDVCRAVNAVAPGIIAEEAKRLRAHLIHYSTNYVFDGAQASAYREEDEPNPLHVYGRSKLDGDRAIVAVGGSSVILRVGWVYSSHGHNFVKTILRLAAQRDELTIVADQYGAPTSADLIADISAMVVDSHIANSFAGTGLPSGIYNLAPAGRTSWYGLATELMGEMSRLGCRPRVDRDRIIPIASKDYPTSAQRPVHSLLDTGKLRRALGVSLPDWRIDVRRVAPELASFPHQARTPKSQTALQERTH